MDVVLGTISLQNDLALDSPQGMSTSDARKSAEHRRACACPKPKPTTYVRYCCTCGRRTE